MAKEPDKATQKAIDKLTEQLKALQVRKSDATETAMNKARDRVSAAYDARIAVVQKQLGALRG
jgi:hypothetical protein